MESSYERFERLLNMKGVTPYRVHKETGIATATLSDWKNNVSTPKPDKMKKIADYFNVSLEYILTGEESKNEEENILTYRDQKDIKAILSTTEELLKQPGLMFEGQPASQESIDSILSAMQIGMEMAKKRNKEKYTPNKYKKE